MAIASQIAERSPRAVTTAKRMANHTIDRTQLHIPSRKSQRFKARLTGRRGSMRFCSAAHRCSGPWPRDG